jgi:hypothetical protein
MKFLKCFRQSADSFCSWRDYLTCKIHLGPFIHLVPLTVVGI